MGAELGENMKRSKMGLGLIAAAVTLAAFCGCNDGDAGVSDLGDGSAGGGDEPTAEGGAAADQEWGERLLLDDCEDGDNRTLLGGAWISYNDSHDPAVGESEVWPASWFEGGQFTMSEPGYGGSGYASRFTGTAATKLGWDYVGMLLGLGPKSFCPDPEPAEFNLATYQGLRFMAKGKVEDGPLVVKILHTKDGEEDNCQDNGLTGDTLTQWADYAADITSQISEEWSEVVLDFREDFASTAPVDIETVLAHAKDIHFFFQTSEGGSVDLTVDDIELYGGGFVSQAVVEAADVPVHDPASPEDCRARPRPARQSSPIARPGGPR